MLTITLGRASSSLSLWLFSTSRRSLISCMLARLPRVEVDMVGGGQGKCEGEEGSKLRCERDDR